MAGQKLKETYKDETTQTNHHSQINTENNNKWKSPPPKKMTKENKSTEHAEQRERRLELLQRQGMSLCPNDTRFLLKRQAARLSEDNLRIFWTKVTELAEAAQQERQTQERLQQTDKNNGRTQSEDRRDI